MKVLMLLENPFPPDPRVEKEILSLVNAGHYVYLLCVEYGNLPEIEKREGWEIHRLHVSKSYFDKIRVTFLAFPLYFNFWRKVVRGFVKEYAIDLIHVHDLPLSKVALEQRKQCGVKVVLDQHEFFSNWIVETSYMNSFAGKIIRLFSDFKKYEKKSLEAADVVITVAEPLREIYLKEYDIQPERLLMIPNTPTRRIFNRENIKQEIINRYEKDFVMFYAGGIDSLRGIDTAIEALSLIKKDIPNAKIVLGGKLTKEYDYTVAARKFGVEDAIDFVGWIDESDLPSYIVASKLCFFTPQANREEINNSIATKNYQYAMMHCPQIVSKAKLISEYVEKNGYGYSVADAHEFAEKARMLLDSNPSSNLSFNKEGLNVWEDTVRPLTDYYQRFNS